MIEFDDQGDLIACCDDSYMHRGEIRDVFLGSIKKNELGEYCFYAVKRGHAMPAATMSRIAEKIESLTLGVG